MATRPSERFFWSTSGTNTPAPTNAEKLAGWVFRQRPPFEFVNWAWNLIGQWVDWLDGGGAFLTLAALDAGVADDECGVVDDWGGAGDAALPGQIFQTAGAFANNAIKVHADGRYVCFTYSADDTVYIRDEDLGAVKSIATSSVTVRDFVSNGTTLWVLTEDGGGNFEIYSYDIETEAENANWGVGTAAVGLCCLFDGVVVIGTNFSGTSDVVYYAAGLGTPTWSYNHGAAVTSVWASGRYVFIAGAAGTGSATLRALRAETGAVVWSDTPTTPVILGADMMAVYVDANGTLQRRSAATGTVAVSAATVGGIPVAGTVDQDFLTIIEAGDERVCGYDKFTLAVAFLGTDIITGTGEGLDVASDGRRLYVARDLTGVADGVFAHVSRPNTPTRYRKIGNLNDVRAYYHLCFAPSE